jgi:single-strand DNA-binding protein
MSFCRVSLLGNLGSDPETRYTQNGTLNVQFSIAVNPQKRRNDVEEPKPIWYRVTAWGPAAERIDKLAQQGYIAKGRSLFVDGKLEPRQFQGNDGQMRWSFDVTLSEFEFTGSNRDQQDQQGGGGYQQGQNQQRNAPAQNQGGYQGNQQQGNQDSGSYEDDMPNIDDVPF